MSEQTDFYTVKLPQPDSIYADGEWITDPERIAAIVAADQVKADAAKAAKGHDCWENVEHSLFESSRGGMQDAYHCGVCGDLLQVG